MSEIDIKYYDPQTFADTHKANIEILKRYKLDKNSVFIDIGAHRGEEISFLQNTECEIHSFECNPLHYDNLYMLYGKNPNITLNKLLVTNSDGKRKRCYFKETSKGGSMSEEPSKRNNSSDYIYAKTSRISTYIKNHELKKINVLKIDAEGSEFKIIEDILSSGVIDKIDTVF